MAKVPSAVWIVDTKKEHLAVDEVKLGLPVIAILDTINCDPTTGRLQDPEQRRRHPARSPC